MGAPNDVEAAVEATLAKAKVAAVRDDPEIRSLLVRFETIKQRAERREQARGPTGLSDINEGELGEMYEMLHIMEAMIGKMEKYQLH
jgi:hypothetical protein